MVDEAAAEPGGKHGSELAEPEAARPREDEGEGRRGREVKGLPREAVCV